METTPKIKRERRRRRRLLAFLLGTTAVGAITTSALSLALFTADTAIGAETFSAGTIHLTAAYSTAVHLTASGMMPGDMVTAPITVTNTGSGDLKYEVTASVADETVTNFGGQFNLQVKDVGAATCDNTTSFVAPLVLSSALPAAHIPFRLLAAAGSPERLCYRVTLDSGTLNAFQGASMTLSLAFHAEQYANNH